MKILTEKEIKESSLERFPVVIGQPTNDLRFGYIEGARWAQQDILSQASEGFEEWVYKYPDKCDLRDFEKPNHNYFVAKESWRASRLSMAKENEALKKENEELKKENKFQVDVMCDMGEVVLENEKLQKENEELVKALSWCLVNLPHHSISYEDYQEVLGLKNKWFKGNTEEAK